MKKSRFCFLILSIVCAIIQETNAQVSLDFGYQNIAPQGDMRNHLNKNLHGGFLGMTVGIPKTKFSASFDYCITGYGSTFSQDKYVFEGGYERSVSIYVSNLMTRFQTSFNYDFLPENTISPYVSAGFGKIRFSTTLEVNDLSIETTDDCPKPLETKSLQNDSQLYLTSAMGLKVNLSKKRSFLDIKLSYLHGGKIGYMNVREENATPTAESVNVKFASKNRPDFIHEYYAADAYQSPIRFFMAQIGFSTVIISKKD